jgi:soluble lytic murein transglycosylase-like protein
MRWIVRTLAVMSVISWIVVAGLLARPVTPSPDAPILLPSLASFPGKPLPADWTQRVVVSGRELFPGAEPGQTASVVPIVERYARRFRVDPLMVLAVIQVESRFDPQAASGQGAIGLMQLQAATARDVASDLGLEWTGDELLLDPDVNVMLGCAYLRQLIDRFGDPNAALAAYCCGPTYVEARRDVNGRIPLAYSDRVWDVLTALQGKVSA